MTKHYAIADIHGMYNIYEQVCDMLAPDDIIYFLGDAGDRGYACFECVKAIYENPQWIYLKGNHEDLMVKGLREHERNNIYKWDSRTEDQDLWMWNGGSSTLEGWIDDGADYDWIQKLDDLPLQANYTNAKGYTFYFSHAGFTRGCIDEMWSTDLVWSRSHFLTPWDYDLYPKDIVMHGHTPIEYLVDKLRWRNDVKLYKIGEPVAYSYCGGHKIDIDNGVFYTNATVIYDLDEMVAIPLYDQSATIWIE